ncbi:DUF4232 domain-containing protein [Streptomyces spinosirectus]|jgi:hypothetical protein|uniref:DUF4232 domain-containing protein n=1 Tax=Streptomyces TaxID=1883 RepID=UPI001C9DBE9A|nr:MULTISPECIES: DUF4232 domain-containing protein [Streptomyces]MBY8340852.1 DUF4232 domain-containing protein [Streptomyces plumbidurans]UIR17976.1 DUF4232 domain-containing protein [Streptomyces spinosirectus]
MFTHFPHLSRRGTAASVTAVLAALATAGITWNASAAPASQPAARAVPTCTVSGLQLSMGRAEGAAGSLYRPISFTNTGHGSCALRGYPGVSVLDSKHHQIGAAATRSGTSYGTVVLAAGHSASAVIRTTNGPVGGACQRTGSYLRVYPPASYKAVLVPAHWKVCSHLFQVGPVNTQGVI